MAGRTHAQDSYRFGFNGKENDGETSTQDYGMRIYNPDLGKFLSVDPITSQYPELTPYQFASNTPIQAIDLDGLEKYHYSKTTNDKGEPVFTLQGSEDLIEYTYHFRVIMVMGIPMPYSYRVKHVNERKEYVAHQDRLGTVENFDKSTFVTYDETYTYSSYTNMVNDVDGDYGGEKYWHYAKKGLQNVSEEIISSGTPVGGGGIFSRASIQGAKWAQKTFGSKFGLSGNFAHLTIDDLTKALKNGIVSPKDVPIDVIVRNGETLILNTRSSVALTKAGIPRSAWNVVDRTGQAFYEGNLTKQLTKNGLEKGVEEIKNYNTGEIIKN